MWSLRAVAGAGWPNSGDVSPEPGRGGTGEGLGVLRVRFVGRLEQGVAGGRGRAGGQWWQPPLAALGTRLDLAGAGRGVAGKEGVHEHEREDRPLYAGARAGQ
jgi:hypothetical protein